MLRLLIAISIPLFFINTLKAQHVYDFNFRDLFPIVDFRLESDVDGDGKLSLVALDSNSNVDKTVEGAYTFVINGFIEDIKFNSGIATLNKSIPTNSVIFIKYENRVENIYRFYASIAGFIVLIPLWVILAVPLLIIIFALAFRKLIYLILILVFFGLIVFSGLDFSSLLNLIKVSIDSLFG